MSTVDEILHAAEVSDDEEATFSKMKLEDILNSKDDAQSKMEMIKKTDFSCIFAEPII